MFPGPALLSVAGRGLGTRLDSFFRVICIYVKLGRSSLKELCPEDKHRVRQLIEELVRVGSEKEKAEEKLRGERKEFQELVLQLRSQHQKVVKEKQGILLLASE